MYSVNILTHIFGFTRHFSGHVLRPSFLVQSSWESWWSKRAEITGAHTKTWKPKPEIYKRFNRVVHLSTTTTNQQELDTVWMYFGESSCIISLSKLTWTPDFLPCPSCSKNTAVLYKRKYINRILLLQILTHFFFSKDSAMTRNRRCNALEGCKMMLHRARSS